MRNISVAGILAAAIIAGGCSSGTYSSVMKEALYEMNNLHHACKRITRKDLVGRSRKDIVKAHDNLKDIAARLAAIPQDDSPSHRREVEKYGVALAAIYGRLNAEAQRISSFPGGKIANEAVDTIYKEILPPKVRANLSRPGAGGGPVMPPMPPAMNPGQ